MTKRDYYFNELEKHIANYNSIDRTIIRSDTALIIQLSLDCITFYSKAYMICIRNIDRPDDELSEIIGKLVFTPKEYTITLFHKKRILPEMSEPLKQLISFIKDTKLDYYFKQQRLNFDIKGEN